MSPSDRAVLIFRTTPGVVGDGVFQHFGIGRLGRQVAVRRMGGRLVRVMGVGYRLIRT